MSEAPPRGDVRYEDIPPHGLQWLDAERIAAELRSRLEAELLRVCRNRRHIYLMLSGGLDSRIIAAALSEAYRRGELEGKPVGVTWGLPDSRDVVYGKEVARILGLEWIHVPLSAIDIVDNVETVAKHLGGLIPALDIHRAMWFHQVEPDAIVLAGSYGDSVGRAEYSGRTVLELEPYSPQQAFPLLETKVALAGTAALIEDFAALRARTPAQPEYVYCEHEQQCHYMRGLFGTGLSVVGRHCDFYQMFTDPSVYGFMWSIHPALRTNEPYACLLRSYNEKLVRLPWPRTNRAVMGRTEGARRQLRPSYHDYDEWVRGPVYDQLRDLVDPIWFAQTGVFNSSAIESLDQYLRSGSRPTTMTRSCIPRTYVWLAAVRRFADLAKERGVSLAPGNCELEFERAVDTIQTRRAFNPLRRWLHRHPTIRRWLKAAKVRRLRRASVRRYPPTSPTDNSTRIPTP
ncbi:MAG: asparagine synthase-related protein [Pirellulales bacterium]